MELSITALAIPAFIAGLLTFLAPCTFPLVPAYLGFISGVSGGSEVAKARRKVFLNGLFYVIGFSLVFIIFGTAVGFLGQTLFLYRIWLARFAGIFIILFGLFMLYPVRNPLRLWRGGSRLERLISNGVSVFKIPILQREWQPKLLFGFERGKPTSSFLLGSAFAFGWTPCIGPVLGSILLLATTSVTAFQGAILLAIFSAGLAIPFLAVAYAWGWATQSIQKISQYLWVVSTISGLILMALGILLLTNRLQLLIPWGYWIFRFINYERLLDYL